MQLGFVYLPFINALFGTAPLGAYALLQSLSVAVAVWSIINAEKWLLKRLHATSAEEPEARR